MKCDQLYGMFFETLPDKESSKKYPGPVALTLLSIHQATIQLFWIQISLCSLLDL